MIELSLPSDLLNELLCNVPAGNRLTIGAMLVVFKEASIEEVTIIFEFVGNSI